MNEIKYSPYFMYNPMFEQKVIDDAITHAKEDWPKESCGAVIDNEYVRLKNVAVDKVGQSDIAIDKFYKRNFIQGKVQAIIHSHDDFPMASVEDQEIQMEMDIPYGIINLKGRSVTHVMFWGEQVPIAPYEGRFFFYGGGFDCYSLVRDWYIENYHVRPPTLARDFAFWYKGVSLFENYMDSMPSYTVPVEEAGPGDVLLYNLKGTKYINHCAIYIEGGLALHHLYNQLSIKMPFALYREFLMRVERFDPNWEGV